MHALTILVSPLDWGLGHASRMVPVIRRLLKDRHNVILAGCGRSLALLQQAFPQLSSWDLPSHRISLASGRFSFLSLGFQIPKIWLDIVKEHGTLERLIRQNHVDIIISDNRYGLYSSGIFSVFVTHQVSPVLPVGFRWLEYPLCRIIRKRMERFDLCWIPDSQQANANLGGDLCHRFSIPSNTYYIGLLSRFDEMPNQEKSPETYETVVILSGPEPQVSQLEKILIRQIADGNKNAFILRGLRQQSVPLIRSSGSHIETAPHLDDVSLHRLISGAGSIITRSGYSGISDLIVLDKHAILIPTPGQSEQEYLGKRLAEKRWFTVITQKELIKKGMPIDESVPERTHMPVKTDYSFIADLYRKYDEHHGKAKQKARVDL